jgi:hypothetical protein
MSELGKSARLSSLHSSDLSRAGKGDAKRSIREYRCGRVGSTAMGAYKAALR